jgi:hypothetical protein
MGRQRIEELVEERRRLQRTRFWSSRGPPSPRARRRQQRPGRSYVGEAWAGGGSCPPVAQRGNAEGTGPVASTPLQFVVRQKIKFSYNWYFQSVML